MKRQAFGPNRSVHLFSLLLAISLPLFAFQTLSAGEVNAIRAYEHDTHWPKQSDRFQWGATSEKKFDNTKSATGVGVDRTNGLVYVLVRDAPYVRVFHENGAFIRAWSPDRVVNVHMLHVDSDGSLWIADNGAHTVTKYSPTGETLLTLGTYGEPGMDDRHFNGPTDVTTTSDGRYIFIADGYTNHRIVKFDQAGRYLGMWGGASAGTKPGEFILPHSITSIDDRLYVADRGGARIQVFDLEGRFIEDWRDSVIPWGLASHKGMLYVVGSRLQDSRFATTDELTHLSKTSIKANYQATTPPIGQYISVFDTNGKMMMETSLPQGRALGEVDWVHGVDIGANGDVYVADVVGNHIQKWNMESSQNRTYQVVENWGSLPKQRRWGATSAIFPARDNSGNIWVAERCGENSCIGHDDINPILLFNSSGKLIKSFGAGLFVWPHGIYVDKANNIWVTDAAGVEGKGHQVHKFNSKGELLMSLGTAGVADRSKVALDSPSDVLVASNGTIFVADGHGDEGNNRIVKFSKEGKYITSWGRAGSKPGEFLDPHALAMDSKGRLFVGDRGNNRIQIFDQDGQFIAQWLQFGRPSGLFIDRFDTLYSADSESGGTWKNGISIWRRGIRIGNAKNGHLSAFIPSPLVNANLKGTSGAEGVVVDESGAIYGAEVGSRMVRKYALIEE